MLEYMHMEWAGGLWAAGPAPYRSVCRCISGHLIGLERHLYTNIYVIREHCAGETRRGVHMENGLSVRVACG